MENKAKLILIVEDEPAHAEAIRRAFMAFRPHDETLVVNSMLKFREAVADHSPSIAIMDIKLPDGSALEVLSSPPESGAFPIVVMTSYGNEEIAVDAMKAGAIDYVVKSPEAFTRMPRTVERALREWSLLQQNKKAEDELQHSRDELQAIYDGSPVMMCTLDADRHVVKANRAFIQATGWPRSGVKSDRACGVMGCINALDDPRGCGYGPHCAACQLRIAIENTLATGTEHENIEYRLVLQRQDRLENMALLCSTTLVPSLNTPQILVCLLDITDRKQAEEHLRESEERYKTFINATDDMVFLKDNQFRYLFVNNANARFFEKSIPDILGADDFALMPTDAARNCRASDERALGEKRVVVEEEHIGDRIYESRKFPVHMKSDLIGVGGFIRDITEQRLAEQNLKDSLEQLRTYFYLPIIGIATTSGEKGWIDMNPKFCEMLGYSEAELRTKKMIDITPAEDMPKLEKIFSDLLCGRISLPHTFEKRYIKKDGAIITTEIATDRVRGTAGEPDYFVSFVQDITERKLAADALRTSEEANRALLNATVDAACIVDLEGNFICLNEQTAARLGKKPEELIGKSIFSGFSPEAAAERKANIRSFLQSTKPAEFEEGRNGRMYHDILYPILDDNGVATRLAIFSRDITEQRLAEQTLKDSLEQLRAYFYLPIIGIATTSIKKGWIDINPKLCQMLGYTEAELRTKSWEELTPAEDFKQDIDRHTRITSGELQLPYTTEKRLIKKDGTIITTEISTDALRGRGNDLFVAFIRDITESKQAQDTILWERDFSQTVIDSVPGLFYVCDSQLRFLRWNKNFEVVTGYCAEEIDRMTPVDILDEHGQETIEEAIWKAAETGETTFETDIISKDQIKTPYFFSKKLFLMGEKPCLLGIGIDITARKQAEASLRTSEEANRALLNATDDAACILDLQCNFICLNEQMAARVNKTVDELMGTSIFNCFSADMDAENKAKVLAMMHSGIAGRFEDKHDGRIFDDNIYPIFDDKGVASRVAIFSHDITEQRHAEQALKDSIEQLRAYFYLPLIGIAKTSIEQGWLEINPKLCDMLGYTEAELRTMNPADINPAGYIPPEINLYNDYVNGKISLPFVYERRCVKKDGGIMYALISTDAIRDAHGNITSFVSFMQDITDRKRSEMNLKESEEKFRKLAELTSFAIMIYQDDNWVYTNPAGEHISGYTAEELYRMKYWEFVAEDYQEKIMRKGKDRQTGEGKPESHEFEIVAKDGSRKWVYLTGSSINYSGRPAGIISVFDITERKRTEAALRESEEKFRSIIDNSGDGIYLFDDKGLITEWNRAAETITQLSKGSVLGRPVWDLYFNFVPNELKEPALLERFRSQIIGFLKTGTSQYTLMDITIQRPDGTRRVLQNSNFSVLLKNRFIFGVIVRDITDRKRDEDALRASLAEKEVMLREIHHRVKNNLQVVSSLVNLQANLTTNPTVLEALKTTSNRIRSMALLHEILYRDPNLAHIDFTVYVESLCRHIVLSSGEVASRVKIETDIFDIGMPLEKSVPCGLIINELVTNAFKHAFPDKRAGSITVSLQPLAVTNEPQGKQNLQLRVSDNGIGLPSDLDPLKTKSLGLKLVSTLALQLGGTVSVEKPEAGGASFGVLFAASEDVEMGKGGNSAE